MPLWIGVFTMSATWVGGGFINGTAEYTYSTGLIWVQAPWGYALSLIVGGLFFVRPMREGNYTTLLDPLEHRFGRKLNRLFFIPALLGDLFWTSAILVALGTTFGAILGLDTETSIVLSGIVVILYTSVGGLWSVAVSDIIQLTVLLIGLTMVVESFGAKAKWWPTDDVLGVSTALWWDSALLLILGGIPWQVYFQRVLASKDTKTAIRLSVFAGFMCLLAAIPPVIIGMVAHVADWSALGLPAPENASTVLPHVIKYLTNPVVATVGLGAIAAAVMSSADSSILASSTLTVWNVLPGDQPERRRKWLRQVIWIVGVCTILLALRVKSIYQLWFLCSDLVYCLLFPALATALFDKKANWIGAVAGFFVALILRSGGGESFLHVPAWIPYPEEDGIITIPFKTLSMLAGLCTIMIVSRLFPTDKK
ncbi:UNVERIFIED_CONTAM: hypothetical protein GTU68_028806 [Idotea baltica]|nr:hypothetical protein [Idotea baltica]